LANCNGDKLNKAFIEEEKYEDNGKNSEEEWYSGNSYDTYNREDV
jgi:hypothetical protein